MALKKAQYNEAVLAELEEAKREEAASRDAEAAAREAAASAVLAELVTCVSACESAAAARMPRTVASSASGSPVEV